MTKHAIAVLSIISITTATPGASAQESAGFPVERLRPAMDRHGIIDTESGRLRGFFEHDAALWLGWSRNPLVLYRREGGDLEQAGTLVQNRVSTQLVGALSLYFAQVGINVPLSLYQDRGAATDAVRVEDLKAFGIGDLTFTPKVQVLRAEDAHLDLAVLAAVTIPTASPDDNYLGESGASVQPEIAVSFPARQMRVALNLGYRARQNSELLDLEVVDEIVFRGAAALELEDLIAAPVEVGVALSGATAAAHPFQQFNQNPLELLGQVTYDGLPLSLALFAGGGVGVVAGWGTPDFRLFGGVRYAPSSPDRDGDGIDDEQDACPHAREDVDGFEDEGCPDPDDDQDGIADADDTCPRQAEDADAFEDDDGCPDPDNDGDRVLDPDDDCPTTPGGETNGCPEHVTITGSKLEFAERVYFATGKSTIEARSYPLLDEVATVLVATPRITKVRIEGHTDDAGDAKDNLILSQDRADAVRRYLIDKGVAKDRLEAVGYGETHPIASNHTERGRSRNRRVEFTIIESEPE